MSSDRTCMMSDLRAAESRLRSDIVAAESTAHRAESRILSIRADIDKTNDRVSSIVSDVGQLSGELSDYRDRLYDLDSEIAHLQVQQEADHRLINHNERLIANIQQDLSMLEENLEHNQQAIEQVRQHAQVLQREADLARRRIDANSRHIQRLEAGVQQINNYLEAERQRHDAERQVKRNDLDAQARLAAELKTQVEPARARFFGLHNEYLSAVTTMDQADLNHQKGNFEVAIGQYQQAQTTLLKVARDLDERERAFENKRAQCRATLDQLESELAALDATDIRTWYPDKYAQLHKRFLVVQEGFKSKQYEGAGEPVEVRLALDGLITRALQIYQDIHLLEARLSETLAQHQERKARLRDIMSALRKVWDQDFECKVNLMNEADPKSTLKLQTVRPGAPNITVYLDLDKTIQFSWTGYEGMKCLEDIQQFEQVMREDNHIVVELVGEPLDRPSNPNPPFDGGPVVVAPTDKRPPKERTEQRK